MEHVGDGVIALGSVASPLGFHALFLQQLAHGLGAGTKEIVGSGGQEGGGIGIRNVFQNLEPGVLRGQICAQIIQLDALTLSGSSGGHVVHTAVQAQGADLYLGHLQVKEGGVGGIGMHGGILAGQLSAGGVTYKEYVLRVHVVGCGVFLYPLQHGIGIRQGCGKLPLG